MTVGKSVLSFGFFTYRGIVRQTDFKVQYVCSIRDGKKFSELITYKQPQSLYEYPNLDS